MPFIKAMLNKIFASQCFGVREIIESAMAPDARIMEGHSNSRFLYGRFIPFAEGEGEIEHPVTVVPVGNKSASPYLLRISGRYLRR
ncbi:hypothetical protein FEF65_06105 [Mariprofundus erugo]|uniref:Uncharacterized protein n=2 Tax=Mariprofundus erugo TaxID=2528639 RepID=A0A5R9GN84_9PROT|nr:hypothetical protein [Mariprofundus erugo]TLS67490.1 hypothetical protein FEF65_06105 [Mariprofundus erugo]